MFYSSILILSFLTLIAVTAGLNVPAISQTNNRLAFSEGDEDQKGIGAKGVYFPAATMEEEDTDYIPETYAANGLMGFLRKARIPMGLGVRLPALSTGRSMSRMQDEARWAVGNGGIVGGKGKPGSRRTGFSGWAFGSCPRCCSWPASWATSCRPYFNCFSC